MSAAPPPWHTLTGDAVLKELGTRSNGLSNEEVAPRLQRYGRNELAAHAEISAWQILADQFKNILIVILLIATAISGALGHTIEAIAIALIVLFAVLLGFIQEYRAERAIAMLKKMAAPTANVIRGGERQTIPARDLVPGDIIEISPGDRIPADARLLVAHSLQTDESSLTGESYPVAKHAGALKHDALAVADRANVAFSGTTATYGRASAVIVATGLATEFGKISGMLAALKDPKTPLQQNLDRLGRVLAIAALVVVAVIVALGILRGEPLLEMLIFGIALAVAVVPEALPAVVTISLALGLQRLARQNALMRYLPAVETLGSASVICTDKTGTLTKDEMTARKLWVSGRFIDVTGSGYSPEGEFVTDAGEVPRDALRTFCEAAVLCCDAELVEEAGRWKIDGDPSEGALITLAAKAGIDKAELESSRPRIGEIPFSSERKRMTTLNRSADATIASSKGAPEVVLPSCSGQLLDGSVQPLSEADRDALRSAATEMASAALRVLAVAYKPTDSVDDAESEMIFLGFAGLMDPPREEVAHAIETCNTAGIRPIMITGDHPETAAAIARELGLLRNGRVLTGAELDALSDDEFYQQVLDIDVYARVSPEQKIRVVDAWQRHGTIVAMTGDGINDAPALKKADIGIAMGLTGTDVSREAADMTLVDDNFASIVKAIAEGRRIFSNIKKFLMFLLSANIGEIGVIAIAALAGLPLPLTAVQILFINLATDGLPALALAVDPPEPGSMRERPRDPQSSIFSRPVVTLMIVGGLWSTAIGMTVFLISLTAARPVEDAMALTFLTLVLIELFETYSFRSDHESILVSPFANRWLNIAVAGELALLVLIVYVPFLQVPFGTFSLTLADWVLVLGLSMTIIPALELTKLAIRRTVPVARDE